MLLTIHWNLKDLLFKKLYVHLNLKKGCIPAYLMIFKNLNKNKFKYQNIKINFYLKKKSSNKI